MKSKRLFIVILLLALISLPACSAFLQKTPAGDILFADDFTDASKKWDQATTDSYTTDYFDGGYRISLHIKDFDAWANPGKENFTDARIEVDATKNGGSDNNDFGVICRYTDKDKFYYGIISSDGFFGIRKMTPSGSVPIGNEKNMSESSNITKGAATNHIRLDCIGSTITLYVNGIQVGQQTDTDYIDGNVGLLAGTLKDPGTDILFDNFFVYKP